ncbi:MAG: hypothetical protein ACRDGM_18030 [bacterium]
MSAKDGEPKVTKWPKPMRLVLVPAGVQQVTGPDGTILNVAMFQLMLSNGMLFAIQTPAGAVPVTIAAMPIPVGKGIVLAGGLREN